MKYHLIFLLMFSHLCWGNGPYWSQTGHRVIGEVAEQHLKPRVKRKLLKLLKGKSLAEVANYADEIKADRSYSKFSAWHYVNFPPDQRYGEEAPSPHGDVVTGIQHSIQVVADKDAEAEEREFYLKMLIHLIGDLHQPMHVGRIEDKGGNTIQLRWFGKGTNLHRLWDTDMINDYGMSYTELAASLVIPDKREIRIIQAGNVLDWVEESQELANMIYDSAEVGEKLGYQYSYKHWHLVERQLLLGGLRLAKVLNQVLG